MTPLLILQPCHKSDGMTNVTFEPYPSKSIYFNFHPLEVVSRYRDPQLQVGENYAYFFLIWEQTFENFDVQTHISFPISVISSINKMD